MSKKTALVDFVTVIVLNVGVVSAVVSIILKRYMIRVEERVKYFRDRIKGNLYFKDIYRSVEQDNIWLEYFYKQRAIYSPESNAIFVLLGRMRIFISAEIRKKVYR